MGRRIRNTSWYFIPPLPAHETVALLNAPRDYLSGITIPHDTIVVFHARLRCAYIHYFAPNETMLRATLSVLVRHLQSPGTLWISWIKQQSPAHTDITLSLILKLALRHHLVRGIVRSLNRDWSAVCLYQRSSHQ